MGAFLYLLIVFASGLFLTRKVIPAVYVRIARMLGFKMRLTPIAQKRMERFKRIKRGYYSFIGISTLFVVSLFLEVIVNEKPLYISYGENWSTPALSDWADGAMPFVGISSFNSQEEFGQAGTKDVDYRLFARACEDSSILDPSIEEARERAERATEKFERLDEPDPTSEFKVERYNRRKEVAAERQAQYEIVRSAKQNFEDGDAFILQTLYPHSPTSFWLELEDRPPNPPDPSIGLMLGTTPSGRDVLVLLLYGFRISMAFALVVAFFGYATGVIVGGIQGYFGGWVDILTQRFVEIWGSIPFLFTIMIIASLMTPTFMMLAVFMIILRSWLGITYYVRGEFYREKSKDYVLAAVGAGVSDWKIITKHILPNALVPVVTFAPFGIVAYITSLVSLDYLGFGLPTGTPSWGALLRMGLENFVYYPHLVIVPMIALAVTLFAVVMVGEAVREAFDPKVFSRLR